MNTHQLKRQINNVKNIQIHYSYLIPEIGPKQTSSPFHCCHSHQFITVAIIDQVMMMAIIMIIMIMFILIITVINSFRKKMLTMPKDQKNITPTFFQKIIEASKLSCFSDWKL